MAAPVGHLTIKFNSIKFNSLGLLFNMEFFCSLLLPGKGLLNSSFST